jgi:diaminohydroxyphosphoribosylaminopyrimidine deaminase/5-amino-6-(5-phosphoribosylamino)uracil reductase
VIPHFTLKLAMTLDGKIATRTGHSKWVTGSSARERVMEIRRQHQAILVGVNTVIADDPSLTVRTLEGADDPDARLHRFILDTGGRIPVTSRVLIRNDDGLTTIIGGPDFPGSLEKDLQSLGVSLLRVPLRGSRIDLAAAARMITGMGIASVLVEGGGQVAASFLEQRLISSICFFYAPKVAGGPPLFPAVGGTGAQSAEELLSVRKWHFDTVGDDIMLTGALPVDSGLTVHPNPFSAV